MKSEASYTVELSLLLPVVLFVLFAPIYMGYEFYSRTEQVSVSGWDTSFCAEKKVRNIKLAGDILEELK